MNTIESNSQALPQGTQLEEFVIEKILGAGGFGITYLARDTSLGRQVVIKENLPTQFAWRESATGTVRPRHTTGGDIEDYEWSMKNFLREAETLASLDHPGIVRVLRKFEANGTAYFVMPFVEGAALDALIKDRRGNSQTFSEVELRGFLERVLDALAYLHDRGIYHRDIKPGNILVSNDGVPALIDFGSARQRLSERSLTVIESPGYTPFEQLQSQGNIGPWSDLYALGATLVKAITFETVPKAADRVMGDPWRGILANGRITGHYSPGFLRSIERALAPLPDDRWQDARQWQEAACSDQAPARKMPRAEVATPSANAGNDYIIDPPTKVVDPVTANTRPVRKVSKDTRNNLIGGACGLAVVAVILFASRNFDAARVSEQDELREAEVVKISEAPIDPTSIPSARLPAKVRLRVDAEIVDATSDLRMTVLAGNRVNLTRVEGQNVIISPGAGSFEGSVPIEQTDLMEQIAAMPDTPPPAEPAPLPVELVASPPPERIPEPPPDPEPIPEHAPEPELAPVPVLAGAGYPVAIMKASIRAGEIKEFTFDQVLKWQAGEGIEIIDGQSYQTGFASYKAETVFGIRMIEAKALIQGDKVVRWFWPKSGKEIK